jgi:hypothetical protein
MHLLTKQLPSNDLIYFDYSQTSPLDHTPKAKPPRLARLRQSPLNSLENNRIAATKEIKQQTPRRKPRHDDSQIVFEAIESSDLEQETQILTDRQREVAERQQMDARIFADISSSSHSTSRRKTDENKPQVHIDSDVGAQSDALVGSSDPEEPESSPPSSPQYAPNHLQSDDQHPPPSSPTTASVRRKSDRNSRDNSQSTPKRSLLEGAIIPSISSSPPPGAAEQPSLNEAHLTEVSGLMKPRGASNESSSSQTSTAQIHLAQENALSTQVPVSSKDNINLGHDQRESASSTSQASSQDAKTKLVDETHKNTLPNSQLNPQPHIQSVVPDSFDRLNVQDTEADESMEDIQTFAPTIGARDIIQTIGHLTPNSSLSQENTSGGGTSTRNSQSKRRRQTGKQLADDDETPTVKKQKTTEVRSNYSTRSSLKRNSQAEGSEHYISSIRLEPLNEVSKALALQSAPSEPAESFTSVNSLEVQNPVHSELILTTSTPSHILDRLEGLVEEAKSVEEIWTVEARVKLTDLIFEIQALSRGIKLD